MLLIQPRRFLRKIYPKALWHLDRQEKSIYLTFDDGPIPGLTEWILEELGKNKIKATFFCVGANILKHPQIYSRILSEGHTAANHSMYHTRGFGSNLKDYIAEAEACSKIIGNNLFRPPYGQMKRGQYRELTRKGYKIVMWDVISYDYEKIEPERCLKIVLNQSRNGSIVVFHDNFKAEKNLHYCLPKFIEHFQNLGYSFKTIIPSKPVSGL
jgi:peptidoglycan-N-acetylglucosamine deacetylase